MPKHAHVESAPPRRARVAATILDSHDTRPRASITSVRGWVWAALIAAVFFWMSNPLVYVPGFHLALPHAIRWTTVVAILTLPWMRLPRVPWPWIAFHALCLASALWTIDPHLTDYTNVLYLKVTLLAVVVAANCEAAVVCWGLGLGGVVVTALSLHAYREEMWGAWDLIEGEDGLPQKILLGVGTNDNILAYTLTVALAATLALSVPRRWPARVAWLGLLVGNSYGLYRAGSATGYVTVLVVLVTLGFVFAWPTLRRRGRRHAVAWTGATLALLTLAFGAVTVALGKDLSTFSGRTPFWRATIESTLDRSPVLGSGWGAAWQHPWSMVPPNEVAQDIADRAGYSLAHGHNFLLDVLPELGLLGVGVALLMVAYTAREVVRNGLHRGRRDPVAGRLILLVLVALLVSGVTEPMLTAPLGWWTLALVAALPRQRVLAHPAPDAVPVDDEPPAAVPVP